MRHILFAPQEPQYDIAILIKDSYFNKMELHKHYVAPLVAQGIQSNKIIAFDLEYSGKKVTAKDAKAYLDKLMPALKSLGVKYIYCADATYFKLLTKQVKADIHLGYVLPCAYIDYMHVIYGLNYSGLVYNPNQYPKLDLSIKTLGDFVLGNFKALGGNVIHSAQYPNTYEDIKDFLHSLHQHPALTCDIETFSLELHKAGIGTIAFAWDEHNGGAFCVDYKEELSEKTYLACQHENTQVRALLRHFFEKYKGKLIFHNASFDAKIKILNLFMSHPQDYVGMLHGLDVMFKDLHDTKVIAFLALNSTADVSLSLKDLTHEYLGNYAQDDIKDIRLIPKQQLLEYNLYDCLGTWFTYKKYYPIMLQDNQEDIYNTIMRPSLKIIAQMEIVGMPIDANQVLKAEHDLKTIEGNHLSALRKSPTVQLTEHRLKLEELIKINAKLKTKQHGIEKVADYQFNPNSNLQLQTLLYKVMGLPVLDTTASKEPATGAATLEKLINHTSNPEYQEILSNLVGLSKVSKILSAFIPAFKSATPKADGMSYLHANFNLNGTVSGRMSCSSPNLQQTPSGSKYAKLIKKCFQAPKGWIFCSADFNALEARIDALLTQDPAKLAVYVDGYDSHAYNAYHYWKPKFPEVKLLPPDSPLRTFSIDIGGVTHTVIEGTIIETCTGLQLPIEEYYAQNP